MGAGARLRVGVSTCDAAAEGRHLEVLQWAWAELCPWSTRTYSRAALGGHLEVLRWARDHHCPWDVSNAV